MTEDLQHIIETLEVIERENAYSNAILETLSYIVELLNNCDPKRLTRTHITRVFKIGRIVMEVRYDGTL